MLKTFILVHFIFGLTGSFSESRKLIAVKSREGFYHYTDSVAVFFVRSLAGCMSECSKLFRCLSFFFNNLTNECILHSDPFEYTLMSGSGDGWSFYLTKDVTNRCKTTDFYHYRELDLCYTFRPAVIVDFNAIAADCQIRSAQLLQIDNAAKQRYLQLITKDIENVYPHNICIQGNCDNFATEWRFDDGTPMTYFNWAQGHPIAGNCYLRIYRKGNYAWYSSPKTVSTRCSYLCEH